MVNASRAAPVTTRGSCFETIEDVDRKGMQIRWAWIPAAIVVVALSWHRRGVLVTVLLVVAGLALGYYVNRRARLRRERGEMD